MGGLIVSLYKNMLEDSYVKFNYPKARDENILIRIF